LQDADDFADDPDIARLGDLGRVDNLDGRRHSDQLLGVEGFVRVVPEDTPQEGHRLPVGAGFGREPLRRDEFGAFQAPDTEDDAEHVAGVFRRATCPLDLHELLQGDDRRGVGSRRDRGEQGAGFSEFHWIFFTFD
jgi:hypothetical protein